MRVRVDSGTYEEIKIKLLDRIYFCTACSFCLLLGLVIIVWFK